MKGRVALAVVLLGAAAICVRLGFWQLSRLREKRVANVRLAESLARPPRAFAWDAPAESLAGGRVEVAGHYDERAQVLLGPRTRDGSPGVDVVTPLVVGEGRAVLVDRGWLYAGDAAWARPQDHPEPGERVVNGIAEPLAVASGDWVAVEREEDGVKLISVRRLDPALRSHLSYELAPVVIRQLPGPGVPDRPARAAPRRADESMHLGYAVQWFLFATIIVGGPLVVAARRRASRSKEVAPSWSRARPPS